MKLGVRFTPFYSVLVGCSRGMGFLIFPPSPRLWRTGDLRLRVAETKAGDLTAEAPSFAASFTGATEAREAMEVGQGTQRKAGGTVRFCRIFIFLEKIIAWGVGQIRSYPTTFIRFF